MRLRNLLYPALALALAGCNLLSGKCTYELRSLETSGTINENGAELVSAQVLVSEERGSLRNTSLYSLVTGATLKGHVLSASLKDASDMATVRLALEIATADRPEISQGAADTQNGANLGGVHDFLAAGRGVIEIQTDIPSRQTIVLPLVVTRNGDWIRPYCS